MRAVTMSHAAPAPIPRRDVDVIRDMVDELLRQARGDDDADEDALAELLAKRLRRDPDALALVCRRVVHNTLVARSKLDKAHAAPARDKATEEVEIRSFAQAVKLKIGLDSILPSGKPLKMHFGRELAALGDTHAEFGEICKRIAAEVPADRTVGATLSASDVAELMMEEPHGRCGRAA